MSQLIGKWKQLDRTNVEGYLALLEIPPERMAQAKENATNLNVEITWAAPVLTVSVTMPHANREIKLQKDTDVEYTTTAGKKLLIKASQVADNEAKAILKKGDGSKEIGFLNAKVTGDTLTTTIKVNDVESTSTFKKA